MTSTRALLSNVKTALYRRPKDELQRLRRWGPRGYFRLGAWQQQMEQAAGRLPALPPPQNYQERALEIWCLTGERFWYQSLFCTYSLATTAGRSVVLHLIDDGTLGQDHIALIRSLFPKGRVLSAQECREQLERELPARRYDAIHRRWQSLMVFRKLTDVHLGSSSPRVFLDSDMLFWRKPDTLLSWYDRWKEARNPDGFTSCFMTDCIESYGYPIDLMSSLSGHHVPRLLNTGVNGIHPSLIDWDEIEYWINNLESRHGTSYYLEQALFAMLSSRSSVMQLPSTEYIVSPDKARSRDTKCCLQHYVYDSKPHYFGEAWRQWMEMYRIDVGFDLHGK